MFTSSFRFLLTAIISIYLNQAKAVVFNCIQAQNSRGRLESILGTSNQNFSPKTEYTVKFAEALLKNTAEVGGFRNSLNAFLQTRIQIAKKNKADKKLLEYLQSEEAIRFINGKAGNTTNVTPLLPIKDFPEEGLRYQGLYDKILKNFEDGKVTESGDNEVSVRYAKEAKQAHVVEPNVFWGINYYEFPDGSQRIVSAVVAKPSRFTGTIFGIYNAFSKDVPKFVKQLELLWDRALREPNPKEQKRIIAEFEWLFFHSNPLGRAAASIGDVMSLSLQMKLGLSLRTSFQHLDFEALPKTLSEYIAWRIKN